MRSLSELHFRIGQEVSNFCGYLVSAEAFLGAPGSHPPGPFAGPGRGRCLRARNRPGGGNPGSGESNPGGSVAKPEPIVEFYQGRGFTLEKFTTCGGSLGCNEFVFLNSAGH